MYGHHTSMLPKLLRPLAGSSVADGVMMPELTPRFGPMLFERLRTGPRRDLAIGFPFRESFHPVYALFI